MFSLHQCKFIWDRLLFLLIFINLLIALQTVGSNEINLPTDPSDRMNGAINVTGDFLRSEKGMEWLDQIMKDRKSPLTTVDLITAILQTTSLNPEVLNAAQTLKDLLILKKNVNGTEILERRAMNMTENPEEHLNDAVEQENDIMCLYRKATFDSDMKKANDWKKLLEIAPGYTIHSVTDKGSKYMICLKKINITDTVTRTTERPIESTTLESSTVELNFKSNNNPIKSTDKKKDKATGKSDDKELPANHDEDDDECYEDGDEGNEEEDNKPQNVDENMTIPKKNTTQIKKPVEDDLEPHNSSGNVDDLTMNTENLNENTNVNTNENIPRLLKKKKRKHRIPRHQKKPKTRKNTRRRHQPIDKSSNPRKGKSQDEPMYLDPALRKGNRVRPPIRTTPVLKNNHHLPVGSLNPSVRKGNRVQPRNLKRTYRVPRRRVIRKRKRFGVIPFVLTMRRVPINSVQLINPLQNIYSPQLEARIRFNQPMPPCQDSYRIFWFPVRMFNPFAPPCKILRVIKEPLSSRLSPVNLPNESQPYVVIQSANLQNNVPNVWIPQEYPTQILAPYANSYDSPIELKFSVQQPIFQQPSVKNQITDCDSPAAQLNTNKISNRSNNGDLNKNNAENAASIQFTVDTLPLTESTTVEDKTTISPMIKLENDTELAAVRMALDDLKKNNTIKSEKPIANTTEPIF